MKKGINAWCFPGNYTIEKCMEISAAAGFDGIEINMKMKFSYGWPCAFSGA